MAALKKVYHDMVSGDIYAAWTTFLTAGYITDANEGTGKKMVEKWIMNLMIFLWFETNALRHLSLLLLDSDAGWLFGWTWSNIGNTAGLLSFATFLYWTQTAFSRLIVVSLTFREDVVLLRTIRCMIWRQGNDCKMARKLLLLSVGLSIMSFSCAALMETAAAFLNLRTAGKSVTALFWLLWYLTDVMTSFVNTYDLLVFPIIWTLLVLNYRTHLSALATMIKNLRTKLVGRRVRRLKARRQFQAIEVRYYMMIREAIQTNRLTSRIMLVLMICSYFGVSILLFMFMHTDNIGLEILCPPIICGLTMLISAMLLFAAHVSSITDQIIGDLQSIAGRDAEKQVLSYDQRRHLIVLMEGAASMALYSVDGHKFTTLSYLLFVIESGIQYTLLITFNTYFALY